MNNGGGGDIRSYYNNRISATARGDAMQNYMPPTPAPIEPGGLYGAPSQYTWAGPQPISYQYTPMGSNTPVTATDSGNEPLYLGQFSGHNAAKDTRAALAQAEFEDYKRRFLPVELQAINDMTVDFKPLTDQELGRTSYAINNAYTAGLGMQNRRLGRYGLTQPTDNAAMERSNVSTLVGGLNATQRNAEDRRNAFIGGGMSTLAEKKTAEGG